jgi:hypothetical protein
MELFVVGRDEEVVVEEVLEGLFLSGHLGLLRIFLGLFINFYF